MKRVTGNGYYPTKRIKKNPRSTPYSRAKPTLYANRPKYRNARTGGFLGAEVKYTDSNINTNIIAGTDASGGEVDPATYDCIAYPEAGTGSTQRIGRKIKLLTIHVKGMVYLAAETNQTSADAATKVYVALVMDKQSNGAQMSSEQCFKNMNGAALDAANPHRNLEFSKRFKVLKTHECVIRPAVLSYDGTNMEQGGDLSPFDFFITFKKPQLIEFSSTSGQVNNVVDKSFHMIAYASGTTPQTTIRYGARIRFSDQ